MSVYEFEHRETGERIERVYPIGRAPKRIGKFVRVPSVPSLIAIGSHVNGKEVHYSSTQLGRQHWKYHRGEFRRAADGVLEPVFSSRRECEELARRSTDDGKPLTYGSCDDWADHAKKRADERSAAKGSAQVGGGNPLYVGTGTEGAGAVVSGASSAKRRGRTRR